MKLVSLIGWLAPIALFGCAVDPSAPDTESDALEEEAAPSPNVGVAQSELLRGLDDSKYCLPGEVVKCTLGPPPVCRCVAAPTTTTTTTATASGFYFAY